MERTEKIGLGIATAAHVLLFGVLSSNFLPSPNPLKLNTPPIDVSMVDEVALRSAAPKVSFEPPPPSEAPVRGRKNKPKRPSRITPIPSRWVRRSWRGFNAENPARAKRLSAGKRSLRLTFPAEASSNRSCTRRKPNPTMKKPAVSARPRLALRPNACKAAR